MTSRSSAKRFAKSAQEAVSVTMAGTIADAEAVLRPREVRSRFCDVRLPDGSGQDFSSA